MSEIVDAQLAEYYQYGGNPEGFPTCPKCEEFVELEDVEYYHCGECGYKWRIE